MSSLTKKPVKSKSHYYFYDGKGWKIETKIKIDGKFVKLNHGWYRTCAEAERDYQNQVDLLTQRRTEKLKDEITFDDFKERYIDYRRGKIRGSSLLHDKGMFRSIFDPLFHGKLAKEAFNREGAAKVQRKVRDWQVNRKNKNKALSYYLQMLEYAFQHECLEQDADYRKCKAEIALITSTEQEDEVNERTVLTSEQLERLYEAIEDAKDKMLTVLMAETGLRIGEAVAVRYSDFDFDARELHIRRIVSFDEFGNTKEYNRTKTKLGMRDIPLSPKLTAIVMSYCKAFGYTYTDLLFPSEESRQKAMDRTAYRRRLDYYCKLANVPHVSPHCLRHTFATLLSERCVTDADRQARAYIMGHSLAVDEQTYTAHNQLETAKKLIN